MVEPTSLLRLHHQFTNCYDAFLRRTAVALSNQTSTVVQYGYDNASRLQNVTNGNAKVTYSYLANSPLVSQINFSNGGVLRMTTTKSSDFLNRLASISSVPSSGSPITYSYTYNNANQRVRTTLADGSWWQYEYDALGQVVSGHKFFPDQTPAAGQQFDYSFDNIGNRTQTLAGGDQNGLNQRLSTYGANNLNQYTNRTVPGSFDVIGLAFATNTVTVTGQAAYQKAEYFRSQVSLANSSAAIWTNIVVSESGQTSVTGNVYVAQSPESYVYDADGNLASDGRWTNTWDGENRLVSMQGLSGIPTGAKLKVDFVYDFRGRRIQKIVSTNSGSAYFAQNTNRFIYDGWNLMATLTPQSSLVQSFVWGIDLSRSKQGAGGVGGLLQLNDTANGISFPIYDGNGNVAGLTKASDGTAGAQYEYGPFGEVIRGTGPMAKVNPFRFSTKCQDDETDLLYYGHRYYDSHLARWNTPDPLGDLNTFLFVRNEPISRIDITGLADYPADDLIIIKLAEAGDKTTPSDMVYTTRFPGALYRMFELAQQTRGEYGDPGKNKFAKWLIGKGTMIIRDGPIGPNTIIHEMTHAIQDVELDYLFNNEEMEEGEAYAMEGFYGMTARLKILEEHLTKYACNKALVDNYWKEFWRTFGKLPSINWGMVSWGTWGGFGSSSRPVNRQDLYEIGNIFDVHLSCAAVAEVANEILGQTGCGLSVKCSIGDSPCSAAPDVTIDPFFQ